MHVQYKEFSEVTGFSPLFKDYISKNPKLSSFYNQYPDIQGFENIIKTRQFEIGHRQVLVDVLKQQYTGIENQPNLDLLLDENTFTVTTGHQLNLCTGPLYVIYKIVSTINLAKALKTAFPTYNFVPVYWAASEDHDFDEISYFNLFGKKYQWQTTQTGAVGRFGCDGLTEILTQLPEPIPVFEKAYTQASTLADAVRLYMHELFGTYGLVTIDADSAKLKSLFQPIVQKELLEQSSAIQLQKSIDALEQLGYKTQVSGREINLFYLKGQLRERIIFENERFKINNSDISLSKDEVLVELANNPERFSPNVILRPVYQECILPNIAYLGGPAEIAYWLQFKTIFDDFGIDFPALLPRNFAMIINQTAQKRMEKLRLDMAAFWKDEISLKTIYLNEHSKNELHLKDEIGTLSSIFQKILDKSNAIDKSLEGAVLGEKQKTINSLENLEKRIKKAEERVHETGINQALALKEKLFPGGSPQERVDNFLNFYINNPHFIQNLIDIFDPLDFRFVEIYE